MLLNNRLKIFIFISLILSSIYVFLVLQNRIPLAHDTFQYLQLQYIFFNEIAQNNSIPLWFPFASHGDAGNFCFYFTLQASPLFPIYSFVALLTKNINYLYLFYFLLLWEEIFFLLGIVLLSSVYYKDIRTILFVSATLVFTSIWYIQIWWNFHLYYFLPITLYCIHKCLETKKFKYFIFFVIFSSLSVYNNLQYTAAFTSFVIFTYVLFLIPFQFNDLKLFLQKNKKIKNITILLSLILIIIVGLSHIKYGMDEVVYINPRVRTSSWKCSLEAFLEDYLGAREYLIREYIEFIGIRFLLYDINLYAGYLLIPFVVIAFLYTRKKISYAVGGVALIVFLFSHGTFVSLLFYYLWPFGNILRYIGLTATIFKLFIVFYAGFGLDIFIEKIKENDKKIIRTALWNLFLVSVLYVFFQQTLSDYPFFPPSIREYLPMFFLLTCAILSINIILFYLLYLKKIQKEYFLNLLLMLVICDLLLYKCFLVFTGIPSCPKQIVELFKPYKYEFLEKRLPHTDMHYKVNNRMKIFYSIHSWRLVEHSTMESFLFIDSAISRYLQTFQTKSISEYFDILRKFPSANMIYDKYSGILYPKIQVFSKLNVVKDNNSMGRIFNLKDFTGDMLFATEKDVKEIKELYPYLIKSQNIKNFKNQNERLHADIQVKKFSFNTLSIKVKVSGQSDKHCFLYYSDTYHPHWRAYVNGKETPIIKSNIGYKSIVIPNGVSDVMFKFGNSFYYISIFCCFLICFAIFCSTIYIFIKEMLWKNTL